jgi:hypothetical protein
MQNLSWSKEMDRIVEERKGIPTEDDENYIRELMKIPNNDISIETVSFKNHQDHF